MISRRSLHHPRARPGRVTLSVALLAVLFSTIYLAWPLRAVQPMISRIEMFNINQVTIHFDTEPNYNYTLQYSDSLATNGALVHTWSNLFTAPAFIQTNHYVIVDYRTNKMRFYRLVATR